jgi:membrane protein CcdC involved in cytochrome C biogenesis
MLVAFGYIIPWRIVWFIKFRRLVSQSVRSDTAA